MQSAPFFRDSMVIVIAGATAITALGCGGEQVAAPLVIASPPRRVVASAAAARSSVELAPPTAPADAPEPEALRFFLDHLAAPAVPPSIGAPPGVATIALDNTALGETMGLTAQGPPVFARLLVGQRLSIPVKLPRGRCATYLAQGGLGVIEIDLFLTTSVEGTVPAFLASEVASGPVAVIGGRRGCMAAPAGAPSDLMLHAIVRRGDGVVLVQAFARDAPAPP